jgi:hypothetical protein
MFRKFRLGCPEPTIQAFVANFSESVWLLRSWKLDQMNGLGFDQDGTAGLEEQAQQRPKNGRMPLRTYIAGLFAVKHV